MLEAREFRTSVVERLFDELLRVLPNDPQIALCGLDNTAGRRMLDAVGFKYLVEAGLGSGVNDFRALRMHTFPGPRNAQTLWPNEPAVCAIPNARAYGDLRSRGIDQCGVTLLADKAVGAPFVGIALHASDGRRMRHEITSS